MDSGHRIRVRRAELRLTQEQLAEIAHLSRRSIIKAEAGGKLHELTQQAIERALQLEPGSPRNEAAAVSR